MVTLVSPVQREKTMKPLLLFFSILFAFVIPQAHAKGDKGTNLIAVGQGISSPNLTSTVNYSSGPMSENPVGTIYQTGARLTGEYDRNRGEGYGGELGYGQGEWGIAAGYYTRKCTNCEGRWAGALGVSIKSLAIGVRLQENVEALGFVFDPNGKHRVGLMGEVNKASGNGAYVTAFGAGYSYVASTFTFALDASTRTYENNSLDKRVYVTPGIALRADKFQVSVNDKITLNRDKNDASQSTGEDQDIWGGVGFGVDKFHFAIYGDYVNELALVVSAMF